MRTWTLFFISIYSLSGQNMVGLLIVDSSGESWLLRSEMAPGIIAISMDFFTIGRPVSGTSDVRCDVSVPTTGNDPTAATTPEGTPAARASTPATGAGTSIGAARTWYPILREITVTLRNFMMKID
jgi:hypothetical protein